MCSTRREISGAPDYVNDSRFALALYRARLKLHNTTIDLQMGDCNLNKANNLKYLGVIIDDTISWVHHITYINNKISKGIT